MAMDTKKARVAEILASDQKRTSALLGVKQFESKWIGWVGVNAPDEIGQRALSNAHLKVFSNIMKDTQIHVLADVDEHEVVKQVQVDKQTGDLYGNRDLLNIARNMTRGIKDRRLRMCTLSTSLFCLKPWEALQRGGLEMWTTHLFEIKVIGMAIAG
ncbi:hypothetical protein IFM89_014687 [Coptis chinensis]|uniref:Uncharacterized protein n=1 Tax=Coptis chinensis TaxID=261450 RepID=A0A835HF38_9MAGN|nr:hypothetical protein IFM89_014687 [Coptis chinensis]